MTLSQQQILAGQAVYTPRTLTLYDALVLGVSNRLIWRCPSARLVAHYNRHISANHLDVGVGTGYFLDKCRFPSPAPRVALMDLNTHSLDHAARRIARYRPERYCRDVLSPIAMDTDKFDSIGLNYLLHCLPGSMVEKAVVFDHLKSLAMPNATVFGSTLLHEDVHRNFPARRLMALYNAKGIFNNQRDTCADLMAALHSRFSDVDIDIIGCVALFAARVA